MAIQRPRLRHLVKFLALCFTATALACEADYAIWIPRSQSADALYRFAKNDKAGYIDGAGHVVIPAILPLFGNIGSEFHDGLLEIDLSRGEFVDRRGKVVLDKGLYRIWGEFSEGLAVAMKKGENVSGYIDTRGEFVISPRFASFFSFSDGFAKIVVTGRVGYIDRSGSFAISPQFLEGSSFVDGMARVVVEGPCAYLPEEPCASPVIAGAGSGNHSSSTGLPACKFTFIDKTGHVITQRRFDDARAFSEALAPVRLDGAWGFIDKTGAVVINPQFEDAQRFSSGLSRVRVNDHYGYIDKRGVMVIQPTFEEADSFSEGFAVVGDGDDRSWYIDKEGQRAFAKDFAAASPFFKGLAHVELLPGESLSVTHAYINTKGRQVFAY